MGAQTVIHLSPIVTKEQYEKAYQFLTEKLEKELPSHLTYHHVQHTRDVITAVEYLLKAEKVPEEDRWLLLTAALFHDAGFLKEYKNHEELSCDIAWETLPAFGYANESIEMICRLIMATKLPQSPSTLYEKIICDADLYYLGSTAFFTTSENLYKELKEEGIIQTDEEWQAKQLQFLEHHRYFTQAAITEREPKKKINIRQLQLKWRIEKKKKRFSDTTAENLKDFFLIALGVFSAGFGLKGFLVPAHFFDGGVTGIALILYTVFHFNLSITTFLLNLPFIVASIYVVNRRFAIKAFIGVFLLACALMLVHNQEITKDKLLISIFGGLFIGIGSGLALRAGSVLDGTEVLALYTLRRTSLTISEIILGINIIIFSFAAVVESLEAALYSILTYLVASKTIDYVVEGVEAYTGVTIISSQSDLIKYRLVNELGRGITVYKGERGFLPGQFETSAPVDIIFTVVTRLELRRLKNVVHEIDPKAFVFANTIREATGGVLRRRQVHD